MYSAYWYANGKIVRVGFPGERSGLPGIYPDAHLSVRFKNKASMEALVKATENSPSLKKFADNLKPVYDYFESKKNLPIILVNQHGEYVIN